MYTDLKDGGPAHWDQNSSGAKDGDATHREGQEEQRQLPWD